MTPENENAILSVLQRHPAGATAKVAAAELRWKETAASLRMGRLASSGLIARTSPAGRPNNLFLYHVKAPLPITPVPERWAPARTIIAGRRTDMVHVRDWADA